MDFNQQLKLELIKLAMTFITAVVVGGGLTAYWAFRQKRRELELLELGRFYDHYGKFLSVLRMWNTFKSYPSIIPPENARWTLLTQANEAEAGIESILVRLASQRRLKKSDQERLGKFRQSFQTLRESIREDDLIKWSSSNHPDYIAFKEGACYLASLLSRRRWWQRPRRTEAIKSLLEITSNKWALTGKRKSV